MMQPGEQRGCGKGGRPAQTPGEDGERRHRDGAVNRREPAADEDEVLLIRRHAHRGRDGFRGGHDHFYSFSIVRFAAVLFPKTKNLTHISIGAGLAWPRFQIDAAYDRSDLFKVGSISMVTRF